VSVLQQTGFHTFVDGQVRAHQTYHGPSGWGYVPWRSWTTVTRALQYQFNLHEHPYVRELIARLVEGSINALQAADTDYVRKADGTSVQLTDDTGAPLAHADGTPVLQPTLFERLFTSANYNPSSMVSMPYPVKDLDFRSNGAYAVYNWELFYHIPLTIAIQLSQNQRYEDAERWFHYVFDPTDDSDGPTPERFWKVKPFGESDVTLIKNVLLNLSTGADPTLQAATIQSIEKWRNDPFQPFAIARYRPTAFMFKAIMAYCDHLQAWGDNYFAQYTPESIPEAAQIYIMWANLLGEQPQAVPKKGSMQPQTYASLRASLDAFDNALVDFETDIPFDAAPMPQSGSGSPPYATITTVGKALYFCVPRNDILLNYWSTVADRLFKIRNSLNIEGIFQAVPLFAPPIDPALLVRAAAAGLDVGAIVSGFDQPLPLVRFGYLVQKATELAQEVRSLGAGLLTAIERQDGEAYALLRARHESTLLEQAEQVKYAAYQEALKVQDAVTQSIANASQRFTFYSRLLGVAESDIKIPQLDALDAQGLAALNLTATEPTMPTPEIPIDIATDVTGLAAGRILNAQEVQELSNLADAHGSQGAASAAQALGAIYGIIPTFGANIEPLGAGATISFGGGNLASEASAFADVARIDADESTYGATMAAKIGAYARRETDWALQRNLAAGEITQLFKQLRAAQIRAAMTNADWSNHKAQIQRAHDAEQYLRNEQFSFPIDDNTVVRGKTTNQAFYLWMRGEVKALYARAFQFAFDIARKAERALQQEIGDPSLSFIQYGYLAGKEGLLAGEKLFADLKRMELAYADLNKREYEMTKHVSVLQLDPVSLIRLRETGSCAISIPEEVFDLDWPAYFRRIKSVAVTIPCVVGPYTSINCRLTLLGSSIRTSTLPNPGNSTNPYARSGADDGRFSDYGGAVAAIVTSTGQDDSGLFETNLHDERVLPFEWSGAISRWHLDLPRQIPQFDFSSIADVVLHVRYTAREAGDVFRKMATDNLAGAIAAAQTNGSVRLFSMRHEFPVEWAKFASVQLGGGVTFAPLTLTLLPQHYPYWSTGRLGSIHSARLFADAKQDIHVSLVADGSNPDTLVGDPSLGGMRTGALATAKLPAPTGQWTIYLDNNATDDLFIALAWGA
jgi:hypothetical protein